MKTLQGVLLVIAFVFLSVHGIRLCYLVWFENRTSVLDEYTESVEAEIREAPSLDDLVKQFEEARAAVKSYESDPNNPKIEGNQRLGTEPYKSEYLVRDAIEDWEEKSERISKVRTYWFFGFMFFVLGVISYRMVNHWVGLAALIVAFSEMIYWSSPPYFSIVSPEYERLIRTKLGLAAASVVLLFLAAFLCRLQHEES